APLPCQGTPEGAESPAPPEQTSPGLPPIEASGLGPAGSEAIITPVTSPESSRGALTWMLPLVWLEKTLNAPSLLESSRYSLPLHTSQQDGSGSITPVPTMATGTSMTPVPTMATGTSVTPVPTVAAGTSTTPVPTVAAGTSTTPVPTVAAGTNTTPVPTMATGTSMTPVPTIAAGTSMAPVLTADIGTFMTPRDLWERSINTSGGGLPCAKDSATETDSLLWHCPREQLKTLPRAELEERLQSTLIIIEAVALQLRSWQESQWLLPGVGPAEQRDVLTQTDITCPEGVREEIYRRLYLEQRRKMEALQRQRGVERDLQRELGLAAESMVAWSSQCLVFRGLMDAACQRLQNEQGALTQKREQVKALMSRCQSVLERVPSKLQSCLEERDAMRQQADE
ncbi:SPAG5 protein, partial [Scytalopus superciliaris]|nr:SPAG5 protein [Scytalopus superciliaris]